MERSVESMFPLSLGIILLLLLAGALFAAPVRMAVLLTGVLFFGSGVLFGRSKALSPWGAGIALLAPFFVTSVFLVAAFGAPFLLFPVLSSGGVAAGIAARRRAPGWRGPFLLGAGWLACVVVAAYVVAPRLFDRPLLN